MTTRDRGCCRIRRKPEGPTASSCSGMKDDKAPFSSSLREASCFENRIRGFVTTLDEGPARLPVLLFLGRLRETPGASASSCGETERCRPDFSVFDRLACMLQDFSVIATGLEPRRSPCKHFGHGRLLTFILQVMIRHALRQTGLLWPVSPAQSTNADDHGLRGQRDVIAMSAWVASTCIVPEPAANWMVQSQWTDS